MEAQRLLTVEGGAKLSGFVLAPPDKSITHRALFLAGLGEGETRIGPLGGGRDNRATIAALEALGVSVRVSEASSGERIAHVTGVGGPHSLRDPGRPIDCMNSGTTMRMLAGILAACPQEVVLTGDDSLRSRPMSRLGALEAMGACLSGRRVKGELFPPISIRGGALSGAEHRLDVASAQVKSALILAGLFAKGPTVIREPMRSRDHTERMLRRLGAEVIETPDGAIMVRPIARPWRVDRIDVAPDLSSAAFFLAAALATRSDGLVVETGANPTRTGFLDALSLMGASLERERLPEVGGEPVERIQVDCTRSRLRGAIIEKELTLRAIDEIALLAGIAAFAEGRTVIRDAGELRVKESDRLSSISSVLRAFGARSTETHDGLIIDGDRSLLHGADVDGCGDHRIAMTAAVMGLGIDGRSRITGAEHIEVSFPRFQEELVRLGAKMSSARAEVDAGG